MPPRFISQIRTEAKREEAERDRAQREQNNPTWYGTPQDPIADPWMGRPILSSEDISHLKVPGTQHVHKVYVSRSEDKFMELPRNYREKRFGTIIKRLEAELMSRDFWMRSLGYDDVRAGRYIWD